MRTRKMIIRQIAKDVQMRPMDLTQGFGLAKLAVLKLTELERKVSPDLYSLLEEQLLGFGGDMQIEMAEDLVIFAKEQIAKTTGCQGADYVLDVCYAWIASELGILKRDFIKKVYNRATH